MYHTSISQSSSRRRRSRPSGGKPARGKGLSRKERARLTQLGICLAVFLTLFLGKGIFPDKLAEVHRKLEEVLVADTDFREAFSALGEALSGEDSILGQVGDFCVEVFGGSGSGQAQLAAVEQNLSAQIVFLNGDSSLNQQAEQYLRLTPSEGQLLSGAEEQQAAEEPAQPEAQTPQPEETQEEPQEEPAVAPVGAVVTNVEYSGPELPANYTMDELSLGELETVTPVLGHLWSEYGYRDHPINGTYTFHNGVDLGGGMGDPIAAFADGVVEYVGENDAHGLYLQLDHGNGIKSFYAHCSKICVTQGQQVSKGEKVAEVGSTGVSTGPHLHLELKVNGIHVNPVYYIDYIPAE